MAAALAVELDHVGWRAAAGVRLSVTAGLVFIGVWVHARRTYDQKQPPVDES